jgi:YjbR
MRILVAVGQRQLGRRRPNLGDLVGWSPYCLRGAVVDFYVPWAARDGLITTAWRPRLTERGGPWSGHSPLRGRPRLGAVPTERERTDAEARVPIEVPKDIEDRVRTLCLALPEVTVRVDESRTRARSTAHSFDIRRRSFCLLVAVEDPRGKLVPLLVLRANPLEREALLSAGHPHFRTRRSRDRIGVLLTDDTDWEEIRELVTESYRILAPKKLSALID